MKKLLSLLVALLIPLQASAQVTRGGPRGSYAGDVSRGAYTVHAVSAFAVVDSIINLESSEGKGFRITKLCIQPGSATTAAFTLWQLIRTTTASSGGTLIANEGTTTNSVSKLYSGDVDWPGIARTGGTEGTSGAVIDQGYVFLSTATTPNQPYCVEYCINSTMCPTVEPYGTAAPRPGVKLMFTGTAGGASQAATIYFVSE